MITQENLGQQFGSCKRPSIAQSGRAREYPIRIYLAGKISKNDWRHKLIPNLCTLGWESGPVAQDDFLYVGPFFVSCDHGCYHGSSTHGQVNSFESNPCPGLDDQNPFDFNRRVISQRCLSAVLASDLVFAYIESSDCFGTLFEIGAAYAWRRKVVIAFAPGIASRTHNDFWFSCAQASLVHYDVAIEDLPDVIRSATGKHA
jgi:hypothetical protein